MFSRSFVGLLLTAAAVIAAALYYLRGFSPVEPPVALKPSFSAAASPGASPQISLKEMPPLGVANSRDPLVRDALSSERGFHRNQKLELAGFELALQDSAAAFSELAQINDPADRAIFLRGLFTAAAQMKPAAAMEWVKRVVRGPDRDHAMVALATAWRGGEPPTFGKEGNGGGEGAWRHGPAAGLGFSLLDGSVARAELAATWARELLTGAGQAVLLGAAAQKIVEIDPQRAIKLGETLEGDSRTAFISALADGWAHSLPDAAWNWAAQLPDPKERIAAITQVLDQWASENPAAGAAALASLEAGKPREAALQRFASSLGREDTHAAFDWAATLSGQERDLAENAVRSVAPVGIGAMLAQNADGYPVVHQLVENGPAARSGQIRSGSQITGIVGQDGTFVDTKGMDIQEVSDKLRGLQGAPVTVYVKNPGESQASPIPLNREQLFFKRKS